MYGVYVWCDIWKIFEWRFIKPKRSNTPMSTVSQNMALFLRNLFPYLSNQVYASGVRTKNVKHEKSWHEYFMHENNISMHENDISLHKNENLARGVVFLPYSLWEIRLYTFLCMELSAMKILGKIFNFMHEHFMSRFFIYESFRTSMGNDWKVCSSLFLLYPVPAKDRDLFHARGKWVYHRWLAGAFARILRLNHSVMSSHIAA